MEEKREKRIRLLTLAFGIALMPPICAVLSPYMGISNRTDGNFMAGRRARWRLPLYWEVLLRGFLRES